MTDEGGRCRCAILWPYFQDSSQTAQNLVDCVCYAILHPVHRCRSSDTQDASCMKFFCLAPCATAVQLLEQYNWDGVPKPEQAVGFRSVLVHLKPESVQKVAYMA